MSKGFIRDFKLTLEVDGHYPRTYTIRHDLYGSDNPMLAYKDLHDALDQMILSLVPENTGEALLDKPWLRKGFSDDRGDR